MTSNGTPALRRRCAEFKSGIRNLERRRPSLVALDQTDPDNEDLVDTWDADRLALEQALAEWGLSARKDGDEVGMNLVCLLLASLDEGFDA